ncbi:desulfoferrodoxin [Methanospirillum stamsii]|uniref:Desulfoferrodoxin n=1 Tax=Methanospirillum stamsii TaxID=1277351 RepID=A0A2V2NHV8_9EURY|nr:desulfoferrodoxin [Methanospirillum stamsii]PWR74923.1 desulfoferrodoxin [Methanospirillum stamsii]
MQELYQCGVCGKIVQIIIAGKGTLVCCNQEMTLVQEKRGEEEGKEKHVPVLDKTATGVKVKVGSVPHPMAEDHYIVQIEVIGDNFQQVSQLKPEDAPEKEFCVPFEQVKKVRIFCNKHGFWTNL